MIYFATVRQVSRVRIGRSENVKKRLSSHKHFCPIPMTLEATTPGGTLVERWFHLRYKACRSHGEWFVLGDAIEADIAALNIDGRVKGQPPELKAKSGMHRDAVITRLRERFNLSTADLAVVLGVTKQTVGQWASIGIGPSRIVDMHQGLQALGHRISLRELVRIYNIPRQDEWARA